MTVSALPDMQVSIPWGRPPANCMRIVIITEITGNHQGTAVMHLFVTASPEPFHVITFYSRANLGGSQLVAKGIHYDKTEADDEFECGSRLLSLIGFPRHKK